MGSLIPCPRFLIPTLLSWVAGCFLKFWCLFMLCVIIYSESLFLCPHFEDHSKLLFGPSRVFRKSLNPPLPFTVLFLKHYLFSVISTYWGFIVSALIFRPMISFKLLFWYGIRGSSLLFYMELSSCSSTVYWRDCFFPVEFLLSYWKSVVHSRVVYFWTLSFVPLICMPFC